ncbi:17373_t:CDS:10, partial [Racocetra fulgida]
MGKSDEALQLCDQADVIDNLIISSLKLFGYLLVLLYKITDDEIVKIYDNATRKNPNNEELSNHWFMAMVRNSDFKGQQQAENAPASQSGIFLELAEHVLEGELGKKCKEDVEINRIRNDLFLKTGNWIKAIEMSKKSLTESNPDDWNSYITYLESYLHLLSEPNKSENAPANLDEAREFLYSLQKSVTESSEIKRGPFLAELKLEKYIDEKLKDCMFGSKACCFEDLQLYLKEIHIDSAKKIIDKFKATIDESDDDKIQEFVALRKELENSLQKALVYREMIRLEILISSKTDKQIIEYLQDLEVSDLSYDVEELEKVLTQETNDNEMQLGNVIAKLGRLVMAVKEIQNGQKGISVNAQKLQNMSLTIKNHLTSLKKQLSCLNELFKNDVEDCDQILLYIKSEPHVEFCDEEESIPFIREILGKIKTNWQNNILNMIKEIE